VAEDRLDDVIERAVRGPEDRCESGAQSCGQSLRGEWPQKVNWSVFDHLGLRERDVVRRPSAERLSYGPAAKVDPSDRAEVVPPPSLAGHNLSGNCKEFAREQFLALLLTDRHLDVIR
jgi:hypothetical protein